ncbi:bifunctional peptidase and arginyl-hydroxylase JMJD5-like [Styela clava]|nr:bifunctional peptidase and arginyl-hydroxylase JMJD5-like isoform X2 [Styela clava]
MYHIHLQILIAGFVVILNVDAEVLFPKDQSLDLVFPPRSRKSATGLPDGHLRPLGWQRTPQGKVKEYTEVIDPKTFWETHVKSKTPLVLKDGYNQSAEIFTTWDDNYLKSEYGEIMVDVTTKKPGSVFEPQLMKLKKFLKRYNMEDWYLVSPVPDEMLHAIPAVPSLLCGSFKKFLQEVEIWMSAGGTSTKLHYDPDHNMHCLVSGRKDFILYEPEHVDIFDFEHDYQEGRGESKIDPEMVNMYEHPKISKTPWTWTTLKPGDCVFIPAGHLHQVRSYGRSLSFSTLWTPQKEFNDTGCAEADIERYTTMNELYFMWKLEDGQRVINSENFTSDPEKLRHHLYSLLRDGDKLRRERFFKYFDKVRNEESREKRQTPHAAFRQMDLKKKNYLTEDDIRKLAPKLLERVTKKYIRPGEADESYAHRDEL